MGADPHSQLPREAISDLLTAMVELVSTWSSLSTQARVAHGVGLNLNEADVRSLHTIGRLGETRPAHLANILQTSRPTTSKSLTRLTAAGFIERSGASDDRRASIIRLTADGHKAYEQLVEAGMAMVEQALDSVPGMHAHTDSFVQFAQALRATNTPDSPNPTNTSPTN